MFTMTYLCYVTVTLTYNEVPRILSLFLGEGVIKQLSAAQHATGCGVLLSDEGMGIALPFPASLEFRGK